MVTAAASPAIKSLSPEVSLKPASAPRLVSVDVLVTVAAFFAYLLIHFRNS
jgi:hypothetical protein